MEIKVHSTRRLRLWTTGSRISQARWPRPQLTRLYRLSGRRRHRHSLWTRHRSRTRSRQRIWPRCGNRRLRHRLHQVTNRRPILMSLNRISYRRRCRSRLRCRYGSPWPCGTLRFTQQITSKLSILCPNWFFRASRRHRSCHILPSLRGKVLEFIRPRKWCRRWHRRSFPFCPCHTGLSYWPLWACWPCWPLRHSKIGRSTTRSRISV